MQTHARILGAAAAAAVVAALVSLAGSQAAGPAPAAKFTKDGKLEYPADYRTWVYLSTGMDMSYADAAQANPTAHFFDNVFVDRPSYDAFQKTGHWPDGTVFALEVRRGTGNGSINKRGQFQTERVGIETHVKDKRFSSGWAFFPFRDDKPSTALPQTSDCNVCHEKHGAVDTTFVQFYPTLLPTAQAKKTFSEAYLADEKPAVK
jgi:hypothetical protein